MKIKKLKRMEMYKKLKEKIKMLLMDIFVIILSWVVGVIFGFKKVKIFKKGK